eukprot:PhF_6_TR23318/c0_g1_i2/m.32958
MIRRFTSKQTQHGVVFRASQRSKVYTSTRPSITTDPLYHNKHVTALAFANPRGNRPAFTDAETNETVSYNDVIENTGKFQYFLKESHGIGKGDVVLLHMYNHIHYASLWHGVVSCGAISSTVNTLATPEDLARQIKASGAKVIVTLPPLAQTAKDAVKYYEANFKADNNNKAAPQVIEFVPEKHFSPESKCVLDMVGTGEDVCGLPFSSGTTGFPKGVQLTHSNITSNLLQVSQNEGMGPGNVALAVLPFFHIYGLVVLMNMGLMCGISQITFKKFDLPLYVKSIAAYKATHLYVAPPLAIALAKHPIVMSVDRTTVTQILSGAAPLGSAVQSEVAARFPNADIRQGYGLTETSPVTHIQERATKDTGTIGILVADTEARIVSVEDGKTDVKEGEEGELWVRGPQVMKGYLKQSDTDAVMAPGEWFKTGDIAKADDNNRFYITDRLKELIKVKGYQVAPAELEAVLLSHPDVQDTVVIAVPHGKVGEVPKAHIVLKPNVTASPSKAEEIQQFVAGKVSPYKKLSGGVRFVESVPKSPSGKLLRRISRELEKSSA